MMDLDYVLDLTGEDHPINKIGGKALNLSKLLNAGFNVPPAFIISVDAYDLFIKGLEHRITKIMDSIDFKDDESLSKGCASIRSLIKSGKIPENLSKEISNKILNLPDGYYAVRSSAVAEDLPDASFAGQLDSFLNIRKEEILEMIILCWASYWNDRAVKYRHDTSVGYLNKIADSGIAVIIQKMVNSDISGVTFTNNPIDGTENILIESSWGLGETIASGIVTPDSFVLSREGDLIKRDIRLKKKGYFLRNGENTLINIPEENRAKASLNRKILNNLVELGIELENFFGSAQDIEWAIECGKKDLIDDGVSYSIYIIQSRPITTLPDITDHDNILWTRAYGDEYWADATTPLFFDVMGKMLTDYVNHEGARIMGYKEITDSKLLKLHKSRVYFNTWVLEKAFSYYPKFARSKELLNYFPLEDQERISRYPSNLHKTLFSQILVAIRDPDGMMHKTDKAYKKWAGKFIKKCEYFDKIRLEKLNDEELLSLYKNIEKWGIKHYQLIRYGMVSHSIATNLMIKNWLIEWLDDRDGSLYAGLISGLEDNKTVEMNIRFSELAKTLRKDPELLSKINSVDLTSLSENKLNKLISQNKSFNKDFELFIKDYGHRSNTREILYPRWKENKVYVLKVIKLLSASDLDLRKKEMESREYRSKIEKEVFDKIKRQRLGYLKAKLFGIVLNLAQTYLIFRENQRFYLDHLLFRQRLMILEMGRRLIKRNVINELDDVFFFKEKELLTFFDIDSLKIDRFEILELRDRILNRKNEFYRYKSSLPPKFLKNGIEFDDTIIEYDKNVVYGTASSPGTFQGKARVIESIEQLSRIQENEILITSNTDPAWTAVFSKIGGLITETGGILSHGAVISREYRIPAVTAVKGATKIFRSGDELIIDGNDGIIYKK